MLIEFVSSEEKLLVLSTKENLVIWGLKANEDVKFDGNQEFSLYKNFKEVKKDSSDFDMIIVGPKVEVS